MSAAQPYPARAISCLRRGRLQHTPIGLGFEVFRVPRAEYHAVLDANFRIQKRPGAFNRVASGPRLLPKFAQKSIPIRKSKLIRKSEHYKLKPNIIATVAKACVLAPARPLAARPLLRE